MRKMRGEILFLNTAHQSTVCLLLFMQIGRESNMIPFKTLMFFTTSASTKHFIRQVVKEDQLKRLGVQSGITLK